jgi:hypothetical protein
MLKDLALSACHGRIVDVLGVTPIAAELREPRERAAGATQSDPHKAPRVRGRPSGIEGISGAQLEVVQALASVSSSRLLRICTR